MKRSLALMLAALMLVSALPLTTAPANMITFTSLNVDKLYAYVGDTLTWTASNNVSSTGPLTYYFRVAYSTAGGQNMFYDQNYAYGTPYSFSSMVNSAGYFNASVDVYDAGENNYATTKSLTTTVSLRPAPKITKVEAISGSALKLTWSKVTGATGYEVWRATSSSGPFTLIRRTTATSLTNTYLKPGQLYVYKIRTYNLVNGVNVTSGLFSANAFGVPLAKPVISSPSGIGRDRVTLTWSKVTGATGYRLLRSTTAAGTYTLIRTLSGTSTTITGLNPGTYYYFKVQAYRKLYTRIFYSPLSAYKVMRTLR